MKVPAGEWKLLLAEIESAKRRFDLSRDARCSVCMEAGRDGFWLARCLEDAGVQALVVDPASIELNRRARRKKTDRLDARKLLAKLYQYLSGDRGVWSVVRIPSADAEDGRMLHREHERLSKERTRHLNRISSLLCTQGLKVTGYKQFPEQLEMMRLWDGSPLRPALKAELLREYERLQFVKKQLREVSAELRRELKEGSTDTHEKTRMLYAILGVGVLGSRVLSTEFYGWREFKNRKQVGALAGLTGSPFSSGDTDMEQGISKAGNRRVKWIAIQLAWSWLRFQPESRLSKWFEERFGPGTKRLRRVGIVALARKLLVELWRYVELGIVPDGAVFKGE